MPRLILQVTALCCFALAGEAGAAANPARSWLVKQGFAPPTPRHIVACHGYGCTRRASVPTGSAWLRRAGAILANGSASPRTERDALRAIIRIYTDTLAAAFGGQRDVPRSPPSLSGRQGQMDCLDTTANTISLLLVLEDAGVLTHHRIDGPQSRGIFLDGRYPHFTAVIIEKGSGLRWAVDPWTRAPGQNPDILPLQQWQDAS